jgi:thiol-disulfide isomerase/thioredoxin
MDGALVCIELSPSILPKKEKSAYSVNPARKESGMTKRWLTSIPLLAVLSASATAAPTVEQMLGFKPRQDGVVCTTPSADKLAGCKVELVKGQQQGSGWALKDEEGNLIRRYYNTRFSNVKDGTKIDVWSYYKDGQEVYREWATTNGQAPDQYRWFNAGGSKWGVDENRDGKIDSWKAISPEEVSQEILTALINRDFARLQPLLLTETELNALDLPSDQAGRIREQLKAASEKFQETLGKLKLSAKASWIHLETVAPQCIAVEGSSRAEVVKHARGTLLYDNGGSSDWIQTGEMYQVGNAWRIVGAPTPGASAPETQNGKGAGQINLEENPELQKLIAELTDLDKQVPSSTDSGSNPKLAQHHLKRADILERIVAKVKGGDRDPWIRQVADSLSTAAQSDTNNEASMTRLLALERQLTGELPAGHTLTAYVTYREMQADYWRNTSAKGKDYNKVQKAWMARLAAFAKTFPKGEDLPDVLLQAGMTGEMLGELVEAKNWYGQVARQFPDKPQAKKAEGAIARLDLEGKTLKLAGPMLSDPNLVFDIEQKRGKVVIVYYWASYNTDCRSDFTKLKGMLDAHSGKVELVCVNLDNSMDEARSYLRTTQAPGTHLHQDGGLESKMATDFGIQVLPTIFLVGKDGKVVSRNGQIANLEDEVKKLVK